jgi:hypothetical protein
MAKRFLNTNVTHVPPTSLNGSTMQHVDGNFKQFYHKDFITQVTLFERLLVALLSENQKLIKFLDNTPL